MKFISLFIIALSIFSCSHIKPYEKEYLVHPFMDDTSYLSLDLPQAAFAKFERLSSTSANVGATSCPTCGG